MGVLSQALANLAAAEQQITNLTGLPPAAVQLQTESAATIAPTIAHIQAMQTEVNTFVQDATSQLEQVETMIAGNQPLAMMQPPLKNVQTDALELQALMSSMVTEIKATSSQVLGYLSQLTTIESDLTAQMTSLQGQLGDAQSSEEATKKKYYWLIALGPLGLAGLAAALALYKKWKSEVNDYESQISALNAQINSFNGMKSACQLMGSDFQGMITKLTGIQNSVGFLTSDILNIEDDVEIAADLFTIGLVVKAASTEITTLGVDAS